LPPLFTITREPRKSSSFAEEQHCWFHNYSPFFGWFDSRATCRTWCSARALVGGPPRGVQGSS
jgi:hypothetical protein